MAELSPELQGKLEELDRELEVRGAFVACRAPFVLRNVLPGLLLSC